jgi:hypothetical protein
MAYIHGLTYAALLARPPLLGRGYASLDAMHAMDSRFIRTEPSAPELASCQACAMRGRYITKVCNRKNTSVANVQQYLSASHRNRAASPKNTAVAVLAACGQAKPALQLVLITSQTAFNVGVPMLLSYTIANLPRLMSPLKPKDPKSHEKN